MLRIPIEALIVNGKEAAFMVVEGRARLVPLTIGVVGEKYVEIISGLKQKDQVITSGNLDLKDGVKIKIVDRRTNLPQKP